MRALLIAVRDHLKSASGLNLKDAECEIVDDADGRPEASGDVDSFVAIHEGSWDAHDCEGLDETYGVQLTVSIWAAKIPDDSGWRILAGTADPVDLIGKRSLLGICESLRSVMHLDVGGDAILNRANSILTAWNGANVVNGFVEPLRIQDMGRTMRKGAAWFGSEDKYPERAGLARTLSFGSARRLQQIEAMR